MAKNSQFWAYFGVFEYQDLCRPKFAPAKKLYSFQFLQTMIIGKLKSQTLDIKWTEITLKYFIHTFISSHE